MNFEVPLMVEIFFTLSLHYKNVGYKSRTWKWICWYISIPSVALNKAYILLWIENTLFIVTSVLLPKLALTSPFPSLASSYLFTYITALWMPNIWVSVFKLILVHIWALSKAKLCGWVKITPVHDEYFQQQFFTLLLYLPDAGHYKPQYINLLDLFIYIQHMVAVPHNLFLYIVFTQLTQKAVQVSWSNMETMYLWKSLLTFLLNNSIIRDNSLVISEIMCLFFKWQCVLMVSK